MTKRIFQKKKKFFKRQSQKGQLTLFFAITLILFVSGIALIINVGLFVKAKINLQNAVDAAAWSGAAVQARQLSNVAYLNWEMRNVFKEWMFKMYVLGMWSNTKTASLASPIVDYTLKPFSVLNNVGRDGQVEADLYNIPSTCIHFAGTETNMCSLQSLPGLPRMPSLGYVGIDDIHNSFVDALVKQKAKDCSSKGALNYRAAMCWLYGNGGPSVPDTAEVACDSFGAWPKAFELALRVRNVESMINAPPNGAPNSTMPLCLNGSGCKNITDLYQSRTGGLPVFERPVKAFWAAFRNLENNDRERNLRQSFQLTELGPTSFFSPQNTLSGVLTPDPGVQKYYVDLQMQLINFVSFFTLFSASTGRVVGMQAEAACSGVKVAIPVPAYPLGVFKNPSVLTYYAVKGQASYTGLFNPFTSETKMTVYAAAKPFGGRIGPILFLSNNSQFLSPRSRSFPYISGLRTNPPPGGGSVNYVPGRPMPLSNSFWVQSGSGMVVGGVPQQGGSQVRFGIPNLLFDFPQGSFNLASGAGGALVQTISEGVNTSGTPTPIGLYDRSQYRDFRMKMGTIAGILNPAMVNEALARAKAPTLYESLNYLIPTKANRANAPQIVTNPQMISLFGPLFGPGTLFPDREANIINGALSVYISNIRLSISAYIQSLFFVSKDIIAQSRLLGSGGSDLPADPTNYINAAKVVHGGADGNDPENLIDCSSIAGAFKGFFLGLPPCRSPTTGEPSSLVIGFRNFLNARLAQNPSYQTHHIGSYRPFHDKNTFAPLDDLQLMTAYVPGVLQGADPSGLLPHPFFPTDLFANRNYYSTKFIALESLLPSSAVNGPYVGGSFTSYSEGGDQPPADLTGITFQNGLDTTFFNFNANLIQQ